MVYNGLGQVKKSLYIFLSSMLGMMLFLVLHRLVIYYYLLYTGPNAAVFATDSRYLEFLAAEYLTLIISLMLGAWYGIWIGLYWYRRIYEEEGFGGLSAHIAGKVWPKGSRKYNLREKIHEVSRNLEEDLEQMENLEKSIPAVLTEPAPVKRRVVKRRTVKRAPKAA